MTAFAIKQPLTAAFFKAQIYCGLIEVRDWLMLPRKPVTWGQQIIEIEATERGKFDRAGFYDRADGGDPLRITYIRQRPLHLAPGDTVILTMTWR